MTDKLAVLLSKSYKLGGTNTNQIEFREPKLADLIAVENVAKGGGNNQVMALMIAQLSGSTYQEVAEFSVTDYERCTKVVSPFLRQGTSDGDA